MSCLVSGARSQHCLALNEGASGLSTFLGACAWKASDRFEVLALTESFSSDAVAPTSPARYRREHCDGREWVAVRYGPVAVVGGDSWTGLNALFAPSSLPTYRVDGVHAFRAFALGNLDESSALIGYPPLHQHHFHVFGSGNPDLDDLNAHGDSQCAVEEGGADCLARSAPLGMAFFLRDRVGFESKFNDVRPNGSRPLLTWVFVALRAASSHVVYRQVRQCLLQFASNDRSGTYAVSTEGESAVWVEGRLAFPLEAMVESYMHTHPGMVHNLLLFQGGAAAVFNDLDAAAPSRGAVQYGPSAIADVLRNVRERQLHEGAATLACDYEHDSPREWQRVGGVWRLYRRKARCHLLPGGPREAVLLVLHRRRAASVDTPTYRLHAAVRFYYAGDNGSAKLAPDLGAPAWAIGKEITYRGLGSNIKADTEGGPAWRKAYMPILANADALGKSSVCGNLNDLGDEFEFEGRDGGRRKSIEIDATRSDPHAYA